MQNPRLVTKIVVNNLVGFGIGSVTSTAVKQSMPRTGNAIVDTVIVVSAFTTSWFVSSSVHNPVRAETERQIDSLFDTLDGLREIKSNN